MIPERESSDVFSATSYEMEPWPLPLSLVIVSQPALLLALHNPLEDTETDPVVDEADMIRFDSESVSQFAGQAMRKP